MPRTTAPLPQQLVRRLLAVSLICAGAVTGILAAAPAEANYYAYCREVTNPFSRCPYPYQGNRMLINYAVQENQYVASHSVCERVERATGGNLISRRCASRRVDSGQDVYDTFYQAFNVVGWGGNDSGSRSTIGAYVSNPY